MTGRADAKTMEGTASLMVELRAGLDAAATEIGAERLLLSVSRTTCLGGDTDVSTLLLAAVLGTSWISQRWMR
jgi:hypothetical protein